MKFNLLTYNTTKTFEFILKRVTRAITDFLIFSNEKKLNPRQHNSIPAFSIATYACFQWKKKDHKKIQINKRTEVLNIPHLISLYESECSYGGKDANGNSCHRLHPFIYPKLEIMRNEARDTFSQAYEKISGVLVIKIYL